MKKYLYTIPAFCLLAACSNFKPDYVIRDASENSRPNWLLQQDAYKSDEDGDKKDYRYFVNDADNVDQRLCLKSAETRATQQIASEVAQEIMSKYKERAVSQDDQATRNIQEQLEQNIKVNLHGVSIPGKYWEKRQYLKEMGAEKDKIEYKCHVAVRISRSTLIEAIDAYKAKTLAKLKPDQKKAMSAALDATVDIIKDGSPFSSEENKE